MSSSDEKTCPFCKEQIRATAIKCRFCGEWLESSSQPEPDLAPKANVAEPVSPPSVSDVQESPPVAEHQAQVTALEPKRKVSSRTLKWVSVGLLLACGILLFVGLWNINFDASNQKQTEALTALILKPLIGAVVVAFAFGRKGYRLLIFSILCVVGALVIAYYSGVESQHSQQTSRRLVTSLMQVHQQAVNGETLKMKPTGDSELDAAFTIPMNVVLQNVAEYFNRMDAEVTSLQKEDVFSRSLLEKQSRIDSEIRKGIKSQEIIARYKKGFRPVIDSARVKFLSTMKAPDDVKLGALKGFDNSMRVQVPQLEEMFSLRLRQENAELSFLLFMRSAFNDYRFTEKTISFQTPSNSKKYNELVQGIRNAIKDAETYQKRQLDAIDATKAKIQELAR